MKSLFDPCRLAGRLFYLLVSLVLACGVARALPPQTTTISDTVYRADGSAATGTLLITWPQFNTSDNKAVASGTMNVTIGASGVVSIALVPNAGASPAGTFYKVVYKLDDGTSSTEYWSVPATSPTTISAIRSTVVPASMAVQVVSRNYVDSGLALKATDNAVVHRIGDTMTGPLNLSGDPSAGLHAATKAYVDAHAGSTPGQITVDGTNFPTIHSAIVAAGTTGSVLIPANYSGSDTDPNPNKIQIADLRGKPNRQRGYINVLVDCGLKGDGVTDDAAAANACFAAYPGWTFYFPPTNSTNSPSYFFNASLAPTGNGTTITGSGATFLNSVNSLGGTVLKFAAGVTGVSLDACGGCTIEKIGLLGSEPLNNLQAPQLLNIPSAANLPLTSRSISSIQRAANMLTVTVTRVAGIEGLTQQVGSTVKITGVVGDSTMNGECIVATLSGNTAFGGNPSTLTCLQNGTNAGPFVSDGTLTLPTTGASAADGIKVCNNFNYIYQVIIQSFGRHGINADSNAGHGCTSAFSDDLIVRDSFMNGNQADGFLCAGVDCNAQLLTGNSVYYNLMWGIEDQSSLGNTHVGNQISNNSHFWAGVFTPPTKTISTISRALTGGSSIVTVALSQADTFLKLGSCVVISGVTDASFNSTGGQCYFITGFTDSSHFQFEQPGAPANASSSGGSERMAKFSEAYLSSGIDDGAQKIQTQSAVAQPTVLNQYVEGGQYCKWGTNTILIGGANTPVCAQGGDWTGQYLSTQGCSGLGGQLCASLGSIVFNKDFGGELNLRAGVAADQTYGVSWLNHSSQRAWGMVAAPSGTLGGSGYFHLTSQGYGQTRLYLAGKDNGTGDTILSAEGSAGRILLNYQNTGTNAGQGGVLFCSGGAASTCPWSVNNAGIATMAAFKSVTANPAATGAVRLAKTDALTFRNNANTADVTALSINGSDQAVLPTIASITSAGSVTAPAFASNSANVASAGAIRLAQADGLKFRNNANTADLNVLSESSDVLQVGETTNGINVPGPANFANLTATGAVTAASISTGGDSFAGTPRIVWGSFLPGALSSTWTAAQFTPKKAINVVQIDLRAKAGPAGCTTFPVVQITDGTTPINVTLNAAGVSQSVTGGQNYAANSTMLVKVSTAGVGCTTAASDVNVTMQYKMQ